MQRVWAIIGLVLIGIWGLVTLIFTAWKTSKRRDYADAFLEKYREFCNSLLDNEFNGELYQWLKLNSAKMQNDIGDYGVAKVYKPAGANYAFKNYQLIVNGIGTIRDLYNQFGDLRLGRGMIRDEILAIDDVILTYIGALDTELDDLFSQIKNPLIWIREGIRSIVTFPISFSYWTGLIQYRTYNKLSRNIITKILSFVLTFVGLIGTIITIVTGYIPFIDKVKKLVQTIN
ncbi:hypothetical protein [Selenihalanaerobacter shriftii]|uniref:Uncharacterized protein n=1 Tax=Selenihalanaerobacter shriftii TaxID=142842 RepID=A0A1T4QEC8_9FIRM|nr:hypothetical protein [Selenihalanaerobacter shriftii]SKA02054.1 hypothetical protein SAMN02745118_02529 [Selenihalanaerobacter shriftii]